MHSEAYRDLAEKKSSDSSIIHKLKSSRELYPAFSIASKNAFLGAPLKTLRDRFFLV